MITARDWRGRIAAVPMQERFWAKVNKTETCWLWIGAKDKDGYGHFRLGNLQTLAHRASYEMHIGAIPKGLTLDHLCRIRHCVNPSHLEAVDCTTNTLRGIGFAAQAARRTHCPQGHIYDLLNTHITLDGKRVCRTCHRIYAARRRMQQGSKAVVEV